MNYWRVTSWSYRNLEIAFEAGVWGTNPRGDLERCEIGDRLAFYSSRVLQGYWGLGTVTASQHISHTRLWSTGEYPFRIGLQVDALLDTPIDRAVVTAKLKAPLKHFRRRSVFELTAAEFDAIAGLVGDSMHA